MKRIIGFTALLGVLVAFFLTGNVNANRHTAAADTALVSHVFTHGLVAYPDIGFKSDNFMRASYNDDCLTPYEFKAILESLYKKNYMLVDVCDTYYVKDGVAFKKDIVLPNGKKPLVMSFDDINYYRKKMHRGMVDKIVLHNGKIMSYTAGKTPEYSDNVECIPILECFVEEHPDFSYNGAKGVINLTGYDGILGYRTDRNSANRESEKKNVVPLIKELKNRGWRFASHSYGHCHMKSVSLERFKEDVDHFVSEVIPLIGETDLYVYPYGEYEIVDNGNVTEKHRALMDAGFKYFFTVGTDDYTEQIKSNEGAVALLSERVPFDGLTMRKYPDKLRRFYKAEEVYDYKNRPQ